MITIPVEKKCIALIIGQCTKILDLTDNSIKNINVSIVFPIYPCLILNKYEPSDKIYLN